MKRKKRHPENAPGGFYVEDGCCTMCGVPQIFAPDLFSAIDDKSEHCFVLKQPETEEQLGRMVDVIKCADLKCIRYSGSNSAIQTRLRKAGEADVCDNLPNFFSFSLRPWGLLTAGGVLACLATLFGFLGRFSWFLDLFSHFRVQYLAGLGVLGLLLLLGRRRKMAATLLGFACVNLVLVLPFYFGKQPVPADAMPRVRDMLINVNTHRGDIDRVRTAITDEDPDILVLEEISDRWLEGLARLTNAYPHALTESREDNFGIGLFSKFPMLESEVVYIGEADVPSIRATVWTGHTNLLVVATHPLPPGGRDYSNLRNEQLDQLSNYVQTPLPVLLLGDLNVTPWNHHFRKLLVRSGLSDSAQGFGVQPSWPNNNPLFRIPIDQCLHSTDIIIVDRRIGVDISSDHYPLIVDFVIGNK
jgi:endonuclease/exonuclease/phosphatase (EEP) superfamily protein YafD